MPWPGRGGVWWRYGGMPYTCSHRIIKPYPAVEWNPGVHQGGAKLILDCSSPTDRPDPPRGAGSDPGPPDRPTRSETARERFRASARADRPTLAEPRSVCDTHSGRADRPTRLTFHL